MSSTAGQVIRCKGILNFQYWAHIIFFLVVLGNEMIVKHEFMISPIHHLLNSSDKWASPLQPLWHGKQESHW